MARARNIKPGFFTNDILAECEPLARILFEGLWCHADKAGRLEDRPKRLKAEILPYDDGVDVDDFLNQLAVRGFILRYTAGGAKYIQVLAFLKHQNPHIKEAESTIPAPCENSSKTVIEDKAEQPKPELAGLIPDSLNPITDSGLLVSDSLIPESTEEQQIAPAVAATAKKAVEPKDEPNPLNLETWQAYKHAYGNRYGVPPVRDAATNAKIKAIVKALGSEAPAVAEFFVTHNGSRYVAGMHQIGLLSLDYAKLRTEWATNTKMTSAKAAQADKTQTNLDAFAPLIAAARAKEQAELEAANAK